MTFLFSVEHKIRDFEERRGQSNSDFQCMENNNSTNTIFFGELLL